MSKSYYSIPLFILTSTKCLVIKLTLDLQNMKEIMLTHNVITEPLDCLKSPFLRKHENIISQVQSQILARLDSTIWAESSTLRTILDLILYLFKMGAQFCPSWKYV